MQGALSQPGHSWLGFTRVLHLPCHHTWRHHLALQVSMIVVDSINIILEGGRHGDKLLSWLLVFGRYPIFLAVFVMMFLSILIVIVRFD